MKVCTQHFNVYCCLLINLISLGTIKGLSCFRVAVRFKMCPKINVELRMRYSLLKHFYLNKA